MQDVIDFYKFSAEAAMLNRVPSCFSEGVVPTDEREMLTLLSRCSWASQQAGTAARLWQKLPRHLNVYQHWAESHMCKVFKPHGSLKPLVGYVTRELGNSGNGWNFSRIPAQKSFGSLDNKTRQYFDDCAWCGQHFCSNVDNLFWLKNLQWSLVSLKMLTFQE